MKRFTAVFLALILMPAAALAAEDEKHYITVNGTAEIKVKPDRLTVTVGIDKRDKNLSAAKNDMDRIIKAAVAFCKKNGVAEKYIQTSHVYIAPNYRDYGDNAEYKINYYQLSQTVTITLEDISKYDVLIYPLLDLGMNTVNSMEFSTSKLRPHRDEARLAAVKAAQEKAKLLTDAAGIKLGKPVNIVEHSQYRPLYGKAALQNVMIQADSGADDVSGVSAGMISITASVDITYEIE